MLLVRFVVVAFLYAVSALTLFAVTNLAPFSATGTSNVSIFHLGISLFLSLSGVVGKLVATSHTLWFVWLTSSAAFIGVENQVPLPWYLVLLVVLCTIGLMAAFVRYCSKRKPSGDPLFESVFAIAPAIALCTFVGLFCNSTIGYEIAHTPWVPHIRTFVYWTFVLILSLAIDSAKSKSINMSTQLASAATLVYCIIYMPIQLAIVLQFVIAAMALSEFRSNGLSAVIHVGD
jgi:hypothetical protein